MSKRRNLRRAGAGLVGATLAVAALAPAALAQERTRSRTITVQVPVVSSKVYGPTRLIGLESPHTTDLGAAMVSGRLWANNIGGLTGGLQSALSSTALGMIADFGLAQNLQGQVQVGIGGIGAGGLSLMGKYTFLNEAYGGAPLSVGALARLSGSVPPMADILKLNFSSAAVGVSFGVPVSKSLTDRLIVMAVPGLSLLGTGAGLVATANLGLGADFAITPRFRAMVDATLGVPSAGLVAAPSGTAFNAGLRYAFTDNFTTDLYFGVGGLQPITGLNLPINVPAMGLAANYRF